MRYHTTIRLQQSLADRLKELAELRDTTVSQLINEAVAQFLTNEDSMGRRIDAARNAIDSNHDELKRLMQSTVTTMKKEGDMQLVKIGELIAMLFNEQAHKSSNPHKPEASPSSSSVDSQWDQVNNLNK